MPGFVSTFANVVVCAHGGQGKPIPPAARVFLMGFAVATMGHRYVITGCSLAGSSSPFCATGTFAMSALRVQASIAPGVLFPVLLAPGVGTCQPTLQPLVAPPAGQARVAAT